MPKSRMTPVIVGTSSAAILLAGALIAMHLFTPTIKRPKAIEGRPLLQQDGSDFDDAQVGLHFTPPADWSMQARTAEAPNEHRPERMLVKYKQIVPGKPLAWLRISVADSPADQTPASALKARKPPEGKWKVVKEVEDGLMVAGCLAARVTFGGTLNPDGRGDKEYTTEMLAIKHGNRLFYFGATCANTDAQSKQRARQTIDTIRFK